MRVQIHLNLANPELAEQVVRIKAPSGAWIGVAYATHLVLDNCRPVVNEEMRQRISEGTLGKKPHAFIEGDLVHFEGRVRDKAPERLKALWNKGAPSTNTYSPMEERIPINYNPRFAKCFYLDQPQKDHIDSQFLSAQRMEVIGWSCMAQGVEHTPLLLNDLCDSNALERTCAFERMSIAKGRKATSQLMGPVLSRPTKI